MFKKILENTIIHIGKGGREETAHRTGHFGSDEYAHYLDGEEEFMGVYSYVNLIHYSPP